MKPKLPTSSLGVALIILAGCSLAPPMPEGIVVCEGCHVPMRFDGEDGTRSEEKISTYIKNGNVWPQPFRWDEVEKWLGERPMHEELAGVVYDCQAATPITDFSVSMRSHGAIELGMPAVSGSSASGQEVHVEVARVRGNEWRLNYRVPVVLFTSFSGRGTQAIVFPQKIYLPNRCSIQDYQTASLNLFESVVHLVTFGLAYNYEKSLNERRTLDNQAVVRDIGKAIGRYLQLEGKARMFVEAGADVSASIAASASIGTHTSPEDVRVVIGGRLMRFAERYAAHLRESQVEVDCSSQAPAVVTNPSPDLSRLPMVGQASTQWAGFLAGPCRGITGSVTLNANGTLTPSFTVWSNHATDMCTAGATAILRDQGGQALGTFDLGAAAAPGKGLSGGPVQRFIATPVNTGLAAEVLARVRSIEIQLRGP